MHKMFMSAKRRHAIYANRSSQSEKGKQNRQKQNKQKENSYKEKADCRTKQQPA